MATYTREELVRRVLMNLGVLGSNEAPDADDAELTEQAYQQLMEELYDESLIPFDIEGPIPARYFFSLVSLTAQRLVLDFGKGSRTPALEANAQRATNKLWSLTAGFYAGQTAYADYY